jgi:hypothetical protein
MKSETQKHQFTQVHLNSGISQPREPQLQQFSLPDRRSPDPSSFLRSDRYPNPIFTEYRSRMVQ